MLRLVVGQNAIGKSVYLNDQLLLNSSNVNINTNLADADFLCSRDYDDERVEHLEEVLDLCDIYLGESRIKITNCEVDVSITFEEIITIICKQGDYLYLDEPEYGLKDWEITRLFNLIIRVADSFKEVIIVTHNELFLGVPDKEVCTVEWQNSSYVLKPVEEDKIYDTID